MFRRILGPSPVLYGIKKVRRHLSIRGGSENGSYSSDDTFFEMMTEKIDSKPPRINNKQLQHLLFDKANKVKLTKEQRLVKSAIEEAQLSKIISESNGSFH